MLINRWQIAITVYLLIALVLIYFKPAMMFTPEGDVKHWSSENTETTSVFSLVIVFPILALLCYYLGVWIELLLA